MWDDNDLNNAKYVAFFEDESRQPLNVGTIEITSRGGGPYLMTPAPPFGSLGGGSDTVTQGLDNCTRIHQKNFTIQYGPKVWPVPIAGNDAGAIWHQYGNGCM